MLGSKSEIILVIGTRDIGKHGQNKSGNIYEVVEVVNALMQRDKEKVFQQERKC